MAAVKVNHDAVATHHAEGESIDARPVHEECHVVAATFAIFGSCTQHRTTNRVHQLPVSRRKDSNHVWEDRMGNIDGR